MIGYENLADKKTSILWLAVLTRIRRKQKYLSFQLVTQWWLSLVKSTMCFVAGISKKQQ